MRSKLEAQWAEWFDKTWPDHPWEYEAEGYDFDGVRYLPDFWFPTLGWYVEVKGVFEARDLNKLSRLASAAGTARRSVLCVTGRPGTDGCVMRVSPSPGAWLAHTECVDVCRLLCDDVKTYGQFLDENGLDLAVVEGWPGTRDTIPTRWEWLVPWLSEHNCYGDKEAHVRGGFCHACNKPAMYELGCQDSGWWCSHGCGGHLKPKNDSASPIDARIKLRGCWP